MGKRTKLNEQIRAIRISILVVFILLILLAGFFVYHKFFTNKINSYLIEKKYYGFELKTPKNWTALQKTIYSDDNIGQLLSGCKNAKSDGTSVYEIGRFRFESQKYPQGFGELGYFTTGLPSGIILDVTVNCIPGSTEDNLINYSYGDLKIGGEKVFEAFLSLVGSDKTEYFSFFHNNLQYRISKYIYISPGDKGLKGEELKQDYTNEFNGIISSFKFTK